MGILSGFFKKQTDDSYYEKRRRPRLSCAVATEFIDARGNRWNCKIVDMSDNGFGITTAAHLRMGNALSIVRPSLEAEVVWARDNKAGLRVLR